MQFITTKGHGLKKIPRGEFSAARQLSKLHIKGKFLHAIPGGSLDLNKRLKRKDLDIEVQYTPESERSFHIYPRKPTEAELAKNPNAIGYATDIYDQMAEKKWLQKQQVDGKESPSMMYQRIVKNSLAANPASSARGRRPWSGRGRQHDSRGRGGRGFVRGRQAATWGRRTSRGSHGRSPRGARGSGRRNDGERTSFDTKNPLSYH